MIDDVIAHLLPFIIGGGFLLGAGGILGWVHTTRLRIRHGYPLENMWGMPIHPKSNAQSDDFDFLVFASPLPAAWNGGIEYVEGSIELLEVGSAKYAVDTHYASPVTGRNLPYLAEQDF